MFSSFAAFIEALPELIKLIKNIQKQVEAAEKKRKLKEDVKVINKAFEEKDAEALRKLFNS